MQPKHKQPNSWQPGCVFPQLQETVGAENFIAISLPTSLPCFHEFCTMPLSKEIYFHSHYRDQSLVTLVLLELSTMIFSGSSPLIIMITITTIQKSYRNIYSLPLFCIRHLFPHARSVGCLLLPSETFSGACPPSCPTKVTSFPWEHSMSMPAQWEEVESLAKEWAQLYGVPHRND